MDASITTKGGTTAYGSTRYRVPVGPPFTVELSGAPHKMQWFADQDDVLGITMSEDTFSATIKPLKAGNSTIQLQGKGPHIDLLINVEVFDDPTVTVAMEFTNVRPREK